MTKTSFIVEIAKQLQAELDKKILECSKYIVQLYKLDSENHPYFYGTGTLITYMNKQYLLSAAHVYDKDIKNDSNSNNECYTFINSELKQLCAAKPLKTSMPASGNRLLDDPYDFIVIPIEKNNSVLFQEKLFFNVIRQKNDIDIDNVYYGFSGFPATPNKARTRYKPTLTNRPYLYCGKSMLREHYKSLCIDPRINFAIEFSIINCFNETDSPGKAPLPNGISGGGVWVLLDFKNLRSIFEPIQLAGIGIEHKNSDKLMVATNINIILDAIDENYKHDGKD